MNEANSISVLIVDDSAIIRKRLARLLTEEPFIRVVGEAAFAVEAILLFEARHPQAVVLDLQMPDASGLEVLRRIKAQESACRVIMLTNHSAPDVRETCLDEGADYVLHKATEFEEVARILQRLAQSPVS